MQQQPEPGDSHIRKLATFIRTNEKGLAEAAFARRRRRSPAPHDPTTFLNPLTWFSFGYDPTRTVSLPRTPKPVALSTDVHHLFYVLMRLEALGYDVGTLDVEFDNPSRPTNYISLAKDEDRSDTLSLTSLRSSFSAVSNLSLKADWWSRPQVVDISSELRYIYSSFTKLPALSIGGPTKRLIAESMNAMPSTNAVPLDSFRNLQNLECIDVDPRLLLGWDRLAESLRALKIKRSGLENIADIFISAVIDDQARRAGHNKRHKRRRDITLHFDRSSTLESSRLPDAIPEVEQNLNEAGSSTPAHSIQLSPMKWAVLRYLSLSENGFTFLPQDILPYLTSLTHLDLSSNLFVSIPSGLGALYNLVSLNLSDNMIDSVLGIYLNLGQILHLNLSSNRLESICGLERLRGLEHVDLRNNTIEESAEIGRLATLPNIAEVWVGGNPFCRAENDYRAACFGYFWKERKSINLDGSPPGFYEKRSFLTLPPEQMSSTRPISTASSPSVVAVAHKHLYQHKQSGNDATINTEIVIPDQTLYLTPTPSAPISDRTPRRKLKRIVNLYENNSEGSLKELSRSSVPSFDSSREKGKEKEDKKERNEADSTAKPKSHWDEAGAEHLDQSAMLSTDAGSFTPGEQPVVTLTLPPAPTPLGRDAMDLGAVSPRRFRHTRYQTEVLPTSFTPKISTLPVTSSGSSETHQSRSNSTLVSRPGARHARVSASLFEGSSSHPDGEDGELLDNAEAYRQRLEALKQDMGDGWLKIYSQTHLKLSS